MNLFSKTLAAAAAALTLAVAFTPAAEARPGRGHGFHGHHRPIGIGAHHLRPRHHYGHRWHGRRHWAGVGLVGYGGCYIARKRVYDPYTGQVVFVRRTVCG